MGDPPLLAAMGQLERIVLAQAAASDPWKQARDAAKKEAAGAEAAAAASAAGGGEPAAERPAEVAAGTAAAPAAPAAAGDAVAPGDVDVADFVAPAEGDEDMDGPAAGGAADGCVARPVCRQATAAAAAAGS